mmetsp:Transcript_10511/g.23150  ORF Transcript_10511/g.23150 Transcript_10511/m.23150 type:complete len:511 (-) Transcript_10511:243-1775(-)
MRDVLERSMPRTAANLKCGTDRVSDALQEARKRVTTGWAAQRQERGYHKVPALILFAGVARLAVDSESFLDNSWYTAFPILTLDDIVDPQTALSLGVLFLVMAVAGVIESLRFPRFVGHSSFAGVARTLLQVLGDFVLIPYYALSPAEAPQLGYQATEVNAQIIAQCPCFKSYFCTPWLRNPYAAFAWYTVLELLPLRSRPEHKINRQRVVMPDGGTVCLDWVEDSMKDEEVTKVLLIASTWSGDSLTSQARTIAGEFLPAGWRVVTFVKRGAGLRMANPLTSEKTFSLDIDEDLITCVDIVQARCPAAFIAGAGISKGAVELRAYAARFGAQSKIRAVVNIDAGISWNECIENVDRHLPAIGKVLADSVNAPCLEYRRKNGSEKFGDLSKVQSVVDFLRVGMIPSHGSDQGVESYMHQFTIDPVSIAVPCLEVLTHNDMLIPLDCLDGCVNLHKMNRNILNLTTVWGTHAMRFSGWSGKCWLPRATFEFLEAASKVGGRVGEGTPGASF